MPQRFRQENGVLLDAVVPERFGFVMEADGDPNSEFGCLGHRIVSQLLIASMGYWREKDHKSSIRVV
ncbi:hypothetical protein [Variovorax atrisoli]|uniref:hypothetical protein n=1 Tax=Variovorax atrisoli TaxID=3394203 RepID=UPI001FC93128|nr:hypothetical protein [Variovorax paradoxus]